MFNFIHKLKIIFTTSISLSITLSLIFTGFITSFVTTNAQEYLLEDQQQEISYLPLAGLESDIVEMTNFETGQLEEENYQEIVQTDEFVDPIIVAQDYNIVDGKMYVGDLSEKEIENYREKWCQRRNIIQDLANKCNTYEYCELKYKNIFKKYEGIYTYDTRNCFLNLNRILLGSGLEGATKKYCTEKEATNYGSNNTLKIEGRFLSQKYFICQNKSRIHFKITPNQACEKFYFWAVDLNYSSNFYENNDNCYQKV